MALYVIMRMESMGSVNGAALMQIFVSYRSLDRNLVNMLVTDLTDMGHTVWYDQELEGGQQWWDRILENIRRCDALVFAMTPSSLESYPCQLEYTYANALHKPILPVKLADHIKYEILPVILQTRQVIDYTHRDVDSFKKLLSALQNTPAAPPLGDTLPTPPPAPISPLAAVRTKIDSPVLTFEQQTAILHQLKGFLYDPEQGSSARELLHRLEQHPTLLASVLRDIQAVLAAPPPAAPVPNVPPPAPVTTQPDSTPSPAAPPAEQTPPAFQLQEGETIIRSLVVDVLVSAMSGLPGRGPFTINIPWVENPRVHLTNRRLVLISKYAPHEVFELPLQEITDLKKKLWQLMTPTIRIETRTLGYCEIALFSVYPAYGNREEFIELIQKAKGQG